MKQTKSHIHRHTRRRILSALTACGLFLSLSITGCSNAPEENDSSTKNTTASAETSSDTASSSLLGDFTAVTQSGETVDQTLFAQADVTMINVWTTFCTYCLDEMPALQSLSEEYKDEGFQVVGIVSDVAKSDDETVQNIIDATGTEYMHIIPSSDLRTGFLKNVQSVPTTFFVDSNGKQIGDPYLGAKDQDAWAKIIEEMLRTVQENNTAGE